MVRDYKDSTEKVPNDLQKDQLKKGFLKDLHDKIVDSLNFQLKNFRVKVDRLTNSRIAGLGNTIEPVRAFYAKFTDDDRNVFWMEFDYNDPEAANIYIGETSAPTSHGECN